MFTINGLVYTMGDADKTKDAYFGRGRGQVAMSLGMVDDTALLFWNEEVAGIELSPTDEVVWAGVTIPFSRIRNRKAKPKGLMSGWRDAVEVLGALGEVLHMFRL